MTYASKRLWGDKLIDEEWLANPEGDGNGRCDVCSAVIVHVAPDQRRECSVDPDHDCYSDDFNNGGDPL